MFTITQAHISDICLKIMTNPKITFWKYRLNLTCFQCCLAFLVFLLLLSSYYSGCDYCFFPALILTPLFNLTDSRWSTLKGTLHLLLNTSDFKKLGFSDASKAQICIRSTGLGDACLLGHTRAKKACVCWIFSCSTAAHVTKTSVTLPYSGSVGEKTIRNNIPCLHRICSNERFKQSVLIDHDKQSVLGFNTSKIKSLDTKKEW